MKENDHLKAISMGEETPIADTKLKKKQLLGGVAFAAIMMVVAYNVVWSGNDGKPKNHKQVEEEFSSMSFRPPSFVSDKEAPAEKPTEPSIIEIKTPAPIEDKPDTTVFEVPPPPPPPVAVASPLPSVPAPDLVPAPAVEAFPERFKSKIVVLSGNGSASAAGGLGGSGGQGAGATVAGEDQNSKYLANAASMGSRSAKATKIPRIDATVVEGTLIPGILETAIVSDLPGQIRAITAQDVYSFDGRRVLIPAGSRLIGEYQSSIARGQKRIFVVWTRLVRDDGVAIPLASIGTDSLGRSGLTGRVDNKWRERFGSAILLSIVGAGASYATGYGSENLGGSSNSQSGADLARETIAQTFSDMANQALSENLRIPPTISVNQGERIFIFVRQDLDFSEYYDDPVTEAMKEIKRERHLR
ncbi:type IV secretion system protein VirB10 (plasmid) [Agrobacterium sp. 13-2099-1-2]|uniref:type IV secretion system protein VirB10 n=1 Tax=Agrobacterium sp. 13-2099-1-2 TaxID=1841651 RepID=UPI00080F94D6|nr:type IV secretion system protein VirB10 [Agrobacterium sp. 13-2099-1-2]UZX45523.1 type IV secretion system protein VirB10 [Agrobacterium sp. 13-2099-1-2]